MICLDSDFLIDLLNNKAKAVEKAENLEKEERTIVTSAINSLELFIGIVSVDSVASDRVKKTRDLLNSFPVIPFDKEAAEKTSYIYNTLKNLGKQIGLKDTMIAGIALTHNMTILTQNIKHFERVTGLKIETWR